ncbi:MAG: lipoprotein [Burkholderiales bacterium]|nr:lipoprotein [Burkholderiales bacterium]
MRRTLLIVLVVLTLQACGTRGPLYLPAPEPPESADAPRQRR